MIKAAPSFAILTVLLTGCGDSDAPAVDAGRAEAGTPSDASDPAEVDGSLDAAVQDESDASQTSPPDAAPDAGDGPRCGLDTTQLDVLLLVDTSASMAEEQALLAQELPSAVRRLATGDVDGDGKAEHKAADLHLGIITPDLGGDLALGKCAGSGDGAALKPFRCAGASGERFLHVPAHATQDQLLAATSQVSCAVQEAGTQGCSFEQQLEASLKATTPTSSALRFDHESLGQSDRDNQGFFRSDSVLVVIVLTDEDDCSVPDANAALTTASGGPFASTPLQFRCELQPQALHPVERYVTGLKASRTHPNAIVMAMIAGVPLDLATDDTALPALLADPRMQTRVVSGQNGERIEPACSSLAADAKPARRLVQVAAGFPARSVVASICEDSMQKPVRAILDRVAAVLTCPDDPVVLF